MEKKEYEIIETSKAIIASDSAAIDKQISTARAFPRQIGSFQRELASIACLDKQTAETMFYTLPRAGKKIVGPSVRFAEAIQYCWTNLRVDAKVTGIEFNYVTALGTCHDLERNVAYRAEVKVRIVDSKGKRYNEDGIMNACNAACSKASRNSVFKCVPMALVKHIFEKTKLVATGAGKSLEEARKDELAEWAKLKVKPEKLYAFLEVTSKDDIDVDTLIALIGYRNSIADGETTLEKLFAKPEEEKKANNVTKPSDKSEPKKEAVNNEPTEEEKAKIIAQEKLEAQELS